MKILFIGKEKSEKTLNKIILNQGKSIKNLGHTIEYFTIKGKGFSGYLKSIFELRSFIKNNNYDLFHAHYSLSGIACSFAGCRPLIVSLMGSDIHHSSILNILSKLWTKYIWDKTIVKSTEMENNLGISKTEIIPNGVDLEMFRPIDKNESRKKLNFGQEKIILFGSNPQRPEKNYNLAKKAFDLLSRSDTTLLSLKNVPFENIPNYLNAVDCLLMTSYYEGSPNIIKEAMACNCPIVSTDVGDIRKNLANAKNCIIVDFDAQQIASALSKIIDSNERSDGREFISELDQSRISERIVNVYKDMLGIN